MPGILSLCLAACLAGTLAAPTVQIPLAGQRPPQALAGPLETGPEPTTEKKRPLHGRFLHITDFHPDKFYQVYSSTAEDAACHSGQGPAGIYGAETSECDSPIALVNKTMEWVARELKDQIDFVVCTGDLARHDNDEDIPRNAEQVVGSNEFVVRKLFEVFGKHNGDDDDDDPNNDFVVPIIPNLGNNDILPHNVITKGPNTWTRTYARIWRQFIPEAQTHQFEQGGWFYVEVIPNKLAVFSINTLYFFAKNAAVDGCASPSEPGYQQMEWLRIQLQFMRDRGVKAIISGHVPPVRQDSKTLWEETCWQKYTLWLRQYRDVIVGSLYGHFNYDHFLLQDFGDLKKSTKHGRMKYYSIEDEPWGGVDDAANDDDEDDEDDDNDDGAHTAVSSNYWIELRDDWSDLPSPPKKLDGLDDVEVDGEDTAEMDDEKGIALSKKKDKKKKEKKRKRERKDFLKAIGGPFAERYAASFVSASVVPNLFPALRVYEYNITDLEHDLAFDPTTTPPTLRVPGSDDEEGLSRAKKNKKHKFTVPNPPSKSSPPGPAYSPQSLSWLKYTQYYANLTHINNDFIALDDGGAAAGDDDNDNDNFEAAKWREGKHKGKKPHDKEHTPRPKKFQFKVHYDTQDDDVYKLKDLTMPSLLDLARRIGNFVPEDDDMMLDDDDVTWEDGDMYPMGNADPDVDEGVDEDDDEDADDDADDDAEMKKQKKKKKKKGKSGKGKHGPKKHRKQNEAWYTFMRRAFVETMDLDEIEDQFGH